MDHTHRKAVPLEPGLLPTCCILLGQLLPVSGGPGGSGGAVSPHKCGPCCHMRVEVCDQAARISSSPVMTPNRFGEFSTRTQKPPPIPGSTGPLCRHCRAPPEVGLLRARVFIPGSRAPVGGTPSVCAQMCLAHCPEVLPSLHLLQARRAQGGKPSKEPKAAVCSQPEGPGEEEKQAAKPGDPGL